MSRLLLLALCCAFAAAGEALTPAQWRERLVDIERKLADGQVVEATKAADELRPLTVTWPAGQGTADPGLSAAVRHGDHARTRRLLATLRQVGSEPLSARDQADHQRLAILDQDRRSQVLAAGGEIGGSLDLPEAPWLDRLRERVADWLVSVGEWFQRFFSGRDDEDKGIGGAVWAWVAAGVAVALLAAVVIASLRRPAPPPAAKDAAASGSADEALAMAADGWLAEAARQLAAGDQRAAIRAWYLGLLAATWERGLLHHRTGWTNWEYVRALPRAWAGGPAFTELTMRFDRVWYGGRDEPAGATAFGDQAHQLIDSLRRTEAR
jgi:hypothetical protein